MVSIFSDSWVDLVFEGRNQQYGAFELRKSTPRNSVLAGLISLSMFGLAIVSPLIIGLFASHHAVDKAIIFKDDGPEMKPRIIEIEQPAAQPPAPKPATAAIPTVIDEDRKVPDEPKPKDVPEANNSGKENATGDARDVPAAGPPMVIDPAPPVNPPDPAPVRFVEEMPMFPGGVDALMKYIIANIHYPPVPKENGVEGTVYVEFVIDKQGNVSGVRAARPVDRFLDREAIRVISSLPKWKPGRQNGKEVAVLYTVPIKFELR